ncbi:MAG TPA: ABC transporter permease [Actinomycetales bacterium]|nr:ABC transporter permease [Actinomycetales bacterium]
MPLLAEVRAVAGVHVQTLSDNCLVRNEWVCPEYVRTRGDTLLEALREHLFITVVSIALGVVLAVPLAIIARRFRRTRPLTLGISTALYTVPSLAMFSLLLPLTGLSAATVITGLVLYSLTILVRNVLAGLDNVDEEVRDAARGMGFSRNRMLFKVELPLALPASFAGLRVATVSTIALTTVGTVAGFGGLGDLLTRGLDANFKAEVFTAAVLCVVIAIAADLLLLAAQRLVTPWQRTRS